MLVRFFIFLAEGVLQGWEILLAWVWIALLEGVLFFPSWHKYSSHQSEWAGAGVSQR